MSILEIAAVLAAVTIGSLVQGSVGFGLNLVAAPLLVLVDPTFVPGPALVMAGVMTVLMTVRERRSIDLKGMGWALGGRVPGTVAGAALVAALSGAALDLAFALMVLAAVAMTASGLHLLPSRPTLFGAGVISGVMGTASSIGGPPMAMVYQRAPGATLRGTLAAYFVVSTIMSIAVLAIVGEFGGAEILRSLILLPPLLVGFLLSVRVAPHLDRGHTQRAVLVVSALGAVSLFVRALVG